MAQRLDYINSWTEAFKKLCSLKYSHGVDSIVVPSDNLKSPKNHRLFEKSFLSLPRDADYVFRDEKHEDSLQIRVYTDGNVEPTGKKYDEEVYHIQLDEHNPSEGIEHAIKHLLIDVIGVDLPSNIQTCN